MCKLNSIKSAVLTAVLILLTVNGSAIASDQRDQTELHKNLSENKMVVRRAIEKILNQGKFELVDELFSPDLVEHDPNQAHAVTAKQAFINAVKAFNSAFPDGVMIIDSQIAERDLVATRWHMTGTHLGDFMGVPKTGKSINITGIFMDRLEDGRLVETWASYDLYGLMQQIAGDD